MNRFAFRAKTSLLPVLALLLALLLLSGCLPDRRPAGTQSLPSLSAPLSPASSHSEPLPPSSDSTSKAPSSAGKSPSPSTSLPPLSSPEEDQRPCGQYLGIAPSDTAGKNGLTYLFLIDGVKTPLKLLESEGYPLQNRLKIGYRYLLTVEKETVLHIEDADHPLTPPTLPPVSVTAGRKTLKNLLSTALLPMGNALYVYGGGWSWQDVGGALQSSAIGVSPYWSTFFNERDASYSYKAPNGQEQTVYYPQNGINNYYFAGLDCSGYLGWVCYNTLYSEDGLASFVVSSTKFAENLKNNGLGTLSYTLDDLAPGDIVSIKGHVWLCIGKCSDGSIVIAHSTPSISRQGFSGGGVQLSAIGNDKGCQAYQLADHYMKNYFPHWYERYPAVLCSPATYKSISPQSGGRFSFDLTGQHGFTDPEGISSLDAQSVLALLFGE
ncbi:MAG: hypothetical protein IJZ33_07620 [Clostridia bacterium]|nr:hypothetical protein [Clostridia bacterium]